MSVYRTGAHVVCDGPDAEHDCPDNASFMDAMTADEIRTRLAREDGWSVARPGGIDRCAKCAKRRRQLPQPNDRTAPPASRRAGIYSRRNSMKIDIPINPDRKRRPTLVVTRGLPGSGKSTAAIAWVNADPDWRVRASRDDLREMGHGRYLGTGAQEAIVSGFQHPGVANALGHGTSVIVDDTNLRSADVRLFEKIAEAMGADFEVMDFRGVPLQVCIDRDAQRSGNDHVGEDVIRAKYDEHIAPAIARGEVVVTRAMVNG